AGFRTTTLPSGEAVPVLGLGTWHIAEDPSKRDVELASLRLGLDLGLRLIDTAEMYADGGAEEMVGEAIAGRRDSVFLVSKVLPHHATRHGTVAACEASLRRLGTDRLDMYLLHWRGSIPLDQTLAGFVELQKAGRIRHWGVSNFAVADMEELLDQDGGDQVETDQVFYNLTHRGIEYDLLPWCRRKLGLPVMAYSPIEQGRLLPKPEVRRIAARHGASPAQIALAWVLRHDGVIAIPKASTPDHVREDRTALDVRLTREDLAELDRAFPPPTHAVPLDIL
ncbi:MAG TPA: aldo/keto reductase, partial [Chloroflexota bacterium]